MNTLEGIIEDVEKSDLVSDKVIKKVRELIGQEKWQELYDEESDIITTTGELLITLKSTKELQEEVNEWKTKFENLERKCRFNFTDLLEDVEKENRQDKQIKKLQEDLEHKKIAIKTRKARIKELEAQIKELEKENEALKGQMSLHEGILWNDLHKLEKENEELKETLGKCAKMPVLYCLGAKETITKARRLIKNLLPHARHCNSDQS